MLDYGWGTGNPSSIMLSSADQTSQPAGPVFDPYNFSPEPAAGFIDPHETSAHFASSANQLPYPHYPNPTHFPNYYDGGRASASAFHPPPPPAGFTMVPKSEPMQLLEFDPRIGLNLGGRTYFATSSSEDDFVNRLYRRSRMFDPAGNNSSSPRCQAEGCAADLSHAKHYHRRHKVCEFHSKCATVVAAGLTQRFCQQCSRFHLLSEFDNGKRSCRKRLDDHNRRRRKSQQTNNNNTNNNNHQENSNTNNNSRLQPRSSPDSGPHSSSVTVAISPTDGFGNGSYSRPTSSSTASTGYTSMY